MPATLSVTGAPVDASGCSCCLTGSPCDCPCCQHGYWTAYTFTVAGITDGLSCIGACSTFNGTWILRHRGGCTWTTDEVTDCGTTICDPYCPGPGSPSPMWTLVCDGTNWILYGAFSTIQWVLIGPGTDFSLFCFVGGTLTQQIRDLAAGCFDSTETTLSLTPAVVAVFVDCDPSDGISYTGSYHSDSPPPPI